MGAGGQDMIFMDFETQSALDLRDGLMPYLHHPSTRIMSAVFLHAGTLYVWVPPDRAPKSMVWEKVNLWPGDWPGDPLPIKLWTAKSLPFEIPEAIRAGAPLVGHNADLFDRLVWEMSFPWCPAEWIDTIHLCRAAGYPGGLDPVVRALGLEGKSDEGKRALKLLYRAKQVDDEYVYPYGTQPLWESMLRYNVRDVLMLERVYQEVGAFGEPSVIRVNNTINRRGCPIDRQFATAVADLWAEYQHTATDRVAELTDGAITAEGIKSPAKCKAWLAARGFPVASVERKYLAELLADPEGMFGDTDHPAVANVIEALLTRQAATRATAAKVNKVLSVVDTDDRVRNMFVYHGAHTGRWSSRDLQLHNMPRGVECDTGAILAAYEQGRLTLDAVRAAAKGARIDDVLVSLMRPIIRAPRGKRLVIIDYATVEARGVAWLAGERAMLDIFVDPKKDIYLDMAGRLYGRECTRADKAERQVGKGIVLGCGYGMGPNKFGATCRAQGVNLEAAGVTPEACVKAFRAAYPAVPALWKQMQEAAQYATLTRERGIAGCVFTMSGTFLEMKLPSGRRLRYRNARIERCVPWWGGEPQPTIIYDGRHFPKNLYGGLLAENAVQAMCRDFVAESLVQLDPVYPVVLHVHDEIVFEVDEHLAERALIDCARHMSRPPAWAPDFPLRVSGFTSDHYVKSPLPGAATAEYMRGERVA